MIDVLSSVFLSRVIQKKKMTVISIVFPITKVLNSHLTCHGTIWKNYKQNRNLIASTIRKSAEVTLSDHQKGRKESEVAKYAEIQS